MLKMVLIYLSCANRPRPRRSYSSTNSGFAQQEGKVDTFILRHLHVHCRSKVLICSFIRILDSQQNLLCMLLLDPQMVGGLCWDVTTLKVSEI